MDLTDKIKNTEVERSIGNNRIVKRDGNDVTYSKKFNFYNENANRYLTILSTVNFNSALYNFYATSEVDEASLHKA